MLYGYYDLIFRSISSKKEGVTLEEICRVAETDERFSYVILNWINDFVKEGKVEIIFCENQPSKYRKVNLKNATCEHCFSPDCSDCEGPF